jgi:hypothetical protein
VSSNFLTDIHKTSHDAAAADDDDAITEQSMN